MTRIQYTCKFILALMSAVWVYIALHNTFCLHAETAFVLLSWMYILQKELDNTAQLWNRYVIRQRRGGISGIPEELYNIPALYGMIYKL